MNCQRNVVYCLIIVHYYTSFSAILTIWVSFQAKNSVRRVPASSALTMSHTEAIKYIPQIYYLRSTGKMNEAQRRRKKVRFGRTTMQALELLPQRFSG